MTELLIEVTWSGITAVEMLYGDRDNIKYIETFTTWHELLWTLQEHMKYYSHVTVQRILPTDTTRYLIR